MTVTVLLTVLDCREHEGTKVTAEEQVTGKTSGCSLGWGVRGIVWSKRRAWLVHSGTTI